MSTVTKRDIVIRISHETRLSVDDVHRVVERLMAGIHDALALGMHVELRDFGVFEVKVRKPRIGRNPNAPEADVAIPARAVVKFKAGKEMRVQVLKLTPVEVEAIPDSPPESEPTP